MTMQTIRRGAALGALAALMLAPGFASADGNPRHNEQNPHY